MGELVRIGDRESVPNPISGTVRFSFKLPSTLMMRARVGDWQRAEPGVVVHVGPSGEVRINARNGSELYARRLATRAAATLLRELQTDRPTLIPDATMVPGNGEREIRYAIAIGSQVLISRAIETPELA
jgi:hypothetical protein